MTNDPPQRRSNLRVLAHPLRLRLLSLLTGTAMSAAEIARELGETQANVSYHLRRLHEAGLLDLAEEVEIRGGHAKRYRYDHEANVFPRAESNDELRLLVAALGAELARRTARQRLDRPDSFTDAELWITPEAWQDALAKAQRLGSELHDAAVAPHAEGAIPVSASLLLFEMSDDARGTDR